MISIQHTETDRNGLFEAWLGDTQVGEMTYQRPTPHRMIIDHTRVFDGFEGRGIARQMVLAAVDFARANSRHIVPVCSYARTLLTRTYEYKMDKMAEGGQFGTKDGHIGRDLEVGT